MTAVVADVAQAEPAGPGLHRNGAKVIGWVGLVGATVLWVRATAGAFAIRSIISDFEAANGPLDLSQGVVAHGSPAMLALCDELVAADGVLFYPFAWGVFVAVALAWLFFAALAWPRRSRHQFTWAAGGALVVLVTQLVLFAAPLAAMVIITE